MAFIGEILWKIFSSVLLVDKNNNLVVVTLIKELTQNWDFLLFFNFNVILFQTVQNKLWIIFNEDFNLILQEFTAGFFTFIWHGTTKHHNLFLSRKFVEDILNIRSHFVAAQNTIAFIDNEIFYILSFNNRRLSLD